MVFFRRIHAVYRLSTFRRKIWKKSKIIKKIKIVYEFRTQNIYILRFRIAIFHILPLKNVQQFVLILSEYKSKSSHELCEKLRRIEQKFQTVIGGLVFKKDFQKVTTVKPLITNTSKESIKCPILHFLIMECYRYLVF